MKKLPALIMVLAIATILLSSMSIWMPTVAASPEPSPLMIYTTIPPLITTETVEDIAERIFGIPGPVVEEIEGLYFVNSSYPRYLEVYQTSGSLWYTDWSKMYNEAYAPNLPTEPQARAIAEDFLITNNLTAPEAYFVGFGNTTSVLLDEETNVTTTIVNSLDVIFGFQIGSQTVDGPGAKIRVSVGDVGEIIGVHWVWRQVEPHGPFPAITEGEAIEILLERFKAEHKVGLDVIVTDSRLAYFAESESLAQAYLQPYYIFDGVLIDYNGEEYSFQTQMVPATVFSPTVSIVSPQQGQRFLVDESITFSAVVQDGGGYYTYEWKLQVNESILLSNEPSFNTTLPCGNEMKQGGAYTPHYCT